MNQVLKEDRTPILRDSNLELLRIFAMLAIIAHHYVVNSTVVNLYDYESPTPQQYFLSIWGMWGKTAINSFILISGYFLCKGNLTWQRWVKLFAQILFYRYLIMIIFALTGYEALTPKGVFLSVTSFLIYINNGFSSSFMCFYAFVPIYNKLIVALNQRQHLLLICGLVTMFTIPDTLFHANVFNEPFWYMTLYFIAAYVRIYPNKYTDNLKFTSVLLIFSVMMAVLSVVVLTYMGVGTTKNFGAANYYFVSNSDKIFAFAVGTSAFLVAKNLPKFQNRIINFFSAGTFAVLLIHASSDTMRHWLWQDLCNVPRMFITDMTTLIIHAIIIPPTIFILCSSVDYLRRRYIERPFMEWLNKI